MNWWAVSAVKQSQGTIVISLERSICLGGLPYKRIGDREHKKRNQWKNSQHLHNKAAFKAERSSKCRAIHTQFDGKRQTFFYVIVILYDMQMVSHKDSLK